MKDERGLTSNKEVSLSIFSYDEIKVPLDYPTIMDAMENALPGDKILINPGIYNEDIDLKNNVSLIGSTNTSTRGGGMYIEDLTGKIYNNIIVNNHASDYGGGIKCWSLKAGFEIGYNNVWGNTTGGGAEENYGTCQTIGEGAIEADPEFEDAEAGDFHLKNTSPCIDTGNPDPVYNDIDGTRNDMGIYGGPAVEGWWKCSVEMNLPPGWSMISLPIIPNNFSVPSLFPGAIVIYDFVKEQGYARVEELEIGKGYWILLDPNQNYTLTGKGIHSYNKTVNQDGWEMIGGCSYPTQASTDRCQISVIYKFIQGIGYKRVTESELLMPGKGYWILLKDITDECKMTVKIIDPNISCD
ncbi:MAG: hypothetical protein JSV09_09825 [Thermoplasmata archaeon]|nr:MAG: hypothetical protein JSV09_09825 [Thermoplasmata archaeon]